VAKEKMRRLLLSILVLPAILNAQNITFTASCNRTQVALGETFILEVRAGGGIRKPKPELPPMNDFNVVSSGRMESISIVNGKASSEVTFTYTLSPRRVGKFTIGSCTVKQKGQTLKTQPIEIEVVQASAVQAIPGSRPSPRATSSPQRAGTGAKALFSTLRISKNTAYVNEQLILSFKLYQGTNLLSSPSYNPPLFTGFWKEDLGQTNKYQTVDGKRYMVNEIRYAIFPTCAGTYTLGPASVQCQVQRSGSRPGGFFSFGGETKVIESNAVKITVKNLPSEGKPTGFSGAVGQYDFSARLDDSEVYQHEAGTVLLSISGAGNIKSVEAPQLSSLPDFKVYYSDTKVGLTNTKDRISGKKTFSVILVPEREGRFEIPGVSFSYFDPGARKYETLTTSPMHLTVLASSKSGSYVTSPGQPIEILGKDIRYIKTGKMLANEGNYIHRSRLFFLFQFIPVIALLVSLRQARQKQKLSRDKAYARAIKADRFVKKGLAQCNRLLDKGEPKDFYAQVYKTLTDYVGGKLNIPGPALTLNAATKSLKERGMNDEAIGKLKSLFSTCDLAKFGLGDLGAEDKKAAYNDLSSLMSELSKKL
jgi:hypothetical protein